MVKVLTLEYLSTHRTVGHLTFNCTPRTVCIPLLQPQRWGPRAGFFSHFCMHFKACVASCSTNDSYKGYVSIVHQLKMGNGEITIFYRWGGEGIRKGIEYRLISDLQLSPSFHCEQGSRTGAKMSVFINYYGWSQF